MWVIVISLCILAQHLDIMKRNVPILGFIIGLILPLLGIIIMYFAWAHGAGFGEFLSGLTTHRQDAAKVISLSLIMNVIPFIYYTSKRLDHTARGVFIATVLYALLIVLLKFDFFA